LCAQGKTVTRDRSGTKDETPGETKSLHHLKTHTRERSATRDEGSSKKSQRTQYGEGTDSAASSDNEDDNSSTDGSDPKKKKIKKSKSRGTMRGSISRQSGTEIKAQLAALGVIAPESPKLPEAFGPEVGAGAAAPLPEGVPAPPPPPGKGAISKEKLLEPEHVRKVLTRLSTPKIDEDLKKWDKKFANYEDVFSSQQVKDDSLHREIIIFPSNDVYVETVKRDVGKLPVRTNEFLLLVLGQF